MTCTEYRNLMDGWNNAPAGGRLYITVDAIEAAVEHVNSCPACEELNAAVASRQLLGLSPEENAELEANALFLAGLFEARRGEQA